MKGIMVGEIAVMLTKDERFLQKGPLRGQIGDDVELRVFIR